ncbi:hypothetical protein ARMSODRAFT_1009236 [Armillaria solidipes]|uniref:Uncharacterized protein n=1 Tax=Armillaria solidipes TaxID=1076256 RepID=A0A2H3B7T6_9AGAR|nr:hypothetical protein ARMSODRAFT_1009236 [Armillaria solidipes]
MSMSTMLASPSGPIRPKSLGKEEFVLGFPIDLKRVKQSFKPHKYRTEVRQVCDLVAAAEHIYVRPLVEVGVRAEIIAVRLQSANSPSYECMWVLAIASKDPNQGWGVPTKKWVMAIMKEYGFRAKPRWLERFTHARSLFYSLPRMRGVSKYILDLDDQSTLPRPY